MSRDVLIGLKSVEHLRSVAQDRVKEVDSSACDVMWSSYSSTVFLMAS